MALIAGCTIAAIAIGQPVLAADTRVVPTARANDTHVVPTKVAPMFVAGAKLSIVAGNNQNATFLAPYAWFTTLAVKATGASGVPIANAPIVFTCHIPGNWSCNLGPMATNQGTINGQSTITVIANGDGVASLDQVPANPALQSIGAKGPFALQAYCDSTTCKTNKIEFYQLTVSAAYGTITSTTFNLSFFIQPVGGLGASSSG
jgi:hypothetical protein